MTAPHPAPEKKTDPCLKSDLQLRKALCSTCFKKKLALESTENLWIHSLDKLLHYNKIKQRFVQHTVQHTRLTISVLYPSHFSH